MKDQAISSTKLIHRRKSSHQKSRNHKFRNNKIVGGTTDFLYSNSLVAKVCFLILIIVLFVIALRLGSKFVMWALSPDKNPILVKGFIDATDPGTAGTIVCNHVSEARQVDR